MKNLRLTLVIFLLLFLNLDGYAEEFQSDYFEEEYFGNVFIEEEFLDGDILKISVVCDEIQFPVLGIAFHLKYDKEKIVFLKYEPGEFLEIGGDPFYLVKNDYEKERIIFGETLRREDDFPIYGGQITDFYFQIFDEEGIVLSFENGVISTLDEVRQDIDKILWIDKEIIRQNDSELIFSSGSDSLSISSIIKGKSSVLIPVILFVLAVIIGILLIFFLQKRDRK